MEARTMPFTWLSLYALFVAILVDSGHGKLLLVQSLFRHGDRAPTYIYPNDPNPPSTWPEGLGKLTQKGKLQQYVVGKTIRSLYSDFITTNPNEVVVNSTYKDRCLRSAQCHVAGLYYPTPEYKFTEEFDWQPIPVHYIHKDDDIYLNPKVDCPRAKKAQDEGYNMPAFKKFHHENEDMLKNLSDCSGTKLTPSKARVLASTVQIELEYNLPIPHCFYPYYNQLQNFADVCHYIVYQNRPAQKLRAGPLLGQVIENMNRKLSGNVPDFKFQVYSARDRNVIAMLSLLNAFNFKKPPYATTILFELHQLDQGPSVRLLLLNSTTPQDGNQKPHVLTVDTCGEYCPLDDFINYAKPYIPKDFKKECQLDS